MDRRTFLKGAAGGQPAPGALPLSQLLVDAAAALTGAQEKRERFLGPQYDSRRSGAPRNASRSGDPSAQQAPPPAPLLMTDPGDLVARALAILAEEDETWQARWSLNLAPRSIR
jgi:hypothetical protein